MQPNRWCNRKSYAEQIGLYVASSLTVLEHEKTCLHMVTLQPLMAFGVIQGYLFLCNLDLSNAHFGALQLHIKTFFCHTSPNLPLGQISCFLWWLAYKVAVSGGGFVMLCFDSRSSQTVFICDLDGTMGLLTLVSV